MLGARDGGRDNLRIVRVLSSLEDEEVHQVHMHCREVSSSRRRMSGVRMQKTRLPVRDSNAKGSGFRV